MDTTPAIPRPDGHGHWPDLYEAVTGHLNDSGFILGRHGLVHADVSLSRTGGRVVTLTLEPSSDEEITRILDALAAAGLRPETERAEAEIGLRRGRPAVIVYAPTPATGPETEPEPVAVEPEPERAPVGLPAAVAAATAIAAADALTTAATETERESEAA